MAGAQEAAGQELVLANPELHQGIQLVDPIGSGTFGIVYKAMVRGQVCAVKILSEALQQRLQSRAAERFSRECEIMNSIKDDNIVQCFGTLLLEQPILVMELMDCNLRKFLEYPKRYYIKVDIVMNIVQAVSYLHSRSIIHRDLSSANVLMKGNIAKVTDFGMSKLLDLSTINPLDLTGCPGTKHYMPPEALTNPPDYNHKIDIFSVGVLVIEILTQQPPNPVDVIKVERQGFEPSFQKCENEEERRVNHIAKCSDSPLKELARHCIRNDKDSRPNANLLCTEVFRIQQQTPQYQQDRYIGEQGMQLAMQWNVPHVMQVFIDHSQVISLQAQKIREGEQGMSLLQSKVSELNQAKEQGMQQIRQLESTVNVLKRSEDDLQHRVSDLEVQLTNNTGQMQREFHSLVA